jgi:hypothetical protein
LHRFAKSGAAWRAAMAALSVGAASFQSGGSFRNPRKPCRHATPGTFGPLQASPALKAQFPSGPSAGPALKGIGAMLPAGSARPAPRIGSCPTHRGSSRPASWGFKKRPRDRLPVRHPGTFHDAVLAHVSDVRNVPATGQAGTKLIRFFRCASVDRAWTGISTRYPARAHWNGRTIRREIPRLSTAAIRVWRGRYSPPCGPP